MIGFPNSSLRKSIAMLNGLAQPHCSSDFDCEVSAMTQKENLLPLSAICLSAVALLLPSTAAAEIKGSPELLDVIAGENLENYNRIRTWKGKVEVVDVREAKGKPSVRTPSTVEFAVDRQRNALRWNWTYGDSVHRVDGKEVKKESYGNWNGMLKDRTYYRLGPPPKTGKRWRYLKIDPKTPNQWRFGPLSDEFDPFYFMSDCGESPHDRFRGLRRLAFVGAKLGNKQAMSHWTVSQDGSMITVASFQADFGNNGDFLINRYEVDRNCGSNIVKFVSATQTYSGITECKYVEKAGAWVPERFTYETIVLDEDQVVQRRRWRKLKWIANVVNNPLNDEEFSWERLGVRDGDYVIDKRNDTKYKIGSPDDPEVQKVED